MHMDVKLGMKLIIAGVVGLSFVLHVVAPVTEIGSIAGNIFPDTIVQAEAEKCLLAAYTQHILVQDLVLFGVIDDSQISAALRAFGQGVFPALFGIFVDVMESVRVVHRLDSFIIDRVCQDIRGIIDSGLPCQPVSVNLSQLDFELCDITDVVFSTMKKYDIPENLIAIEITESAVASGMKMLDEKIREFRAHGLEVWIDDFGSGYSSFSNLQNHDFDTLKIDMGFVRGIGNNPKSEVIIASIVSMSKRLGLASLAEGVETEEQYEFLRRIGCGLIQGYFFGKPEPYENRVTKTSKVAVQPEEPSMRAYYDKICSVNLLSNNPHAIISDFDDQPFNSYNSLPILLIEVDWTDYTVSFLYINNAYRKFMESIGIGSTDEIESFFGPEARENMRKVYEDAENNPDEVLSFNVDLDEKTVIKCRIRFLARAGETCAYSFSARLKDS